jgi:hypothetical protein
VDIRSWRRRQHPSFAQRLSFQHRLRSATPSSSDEHQDANVHQHEVIMACHAAGAQVRIFGDPVQRIYGGRAKDESTAEEQRWHQLKTMADVFEQLDEPHRWLNGSAELGRWILEARASLRDGGKIDLRGRLPQGLSVRKTALRSSVADIKSYRQSVGQSTLSSMSRHHYLCSPLKTILLMPFEPFSIDVCRYGKGMCANPFRSS